MSGIMLNMLGGSFGGGVIQLTPDDFNLSNATAVVGTVAVNVTNNDMNNPYGIWFNPISNRLGIGKANSDTVYPGYERVLLASDGSISSVNYSGGPYWTGGGTFTATYTAMTHKFLDNGKKFLSQSYSNHVKTWTLSTPWDISTASLLSTLPSGPQAYVGNAYGCDISTDGSLFISSPRTANAQMSVFQLSTPFDLSTASLWKYRQFNDANFTPMGINFNSDATQVLIVSGDASSYDNIRQYSMTTPGDITTATLDYTLSNGNFSRITEVAFNVAKSKMYVLDNGQNGIMTFNI